MDDDESVEDAEDQSQTEDSSEGMCNGSLGRAILHTVQQQEQQQQKGKKVSSGRKLFSQRVIKSPTNFSFSGTLCRAGSLL